MKFWSTNHITHKQGRILRRKLLKPRLVDWKRQSGRREEKTPQSKESSNDVMIRIQYVRSFFAWRRRAAFRTQRINCLTIELFKATPRTLREAFARWTSVVAWLWMGESRLFGMIRAQR